MFDLRPGDNSDLPDFDELANHLLEQGIQSSPSELHGCLAGLFAGGAGRERSIGLAGLVKALDIDVHGELADGLQLMYARTVSSAESENLHFDPLLPDDATELPQRTQALADWCRGFLCGFAEGRVSAGLTEAGVAADSAEALRDFAAIAQADAEEDDPEEAERAYAELVEYLRVAAMNVIADTQQLFSDSGATSDSTLH